jgi:putative mRNA 3-end processing factor
MILEDFLVFDDKGLYCSYGQFYLDPIQPVDLAVISHAHGDHATGGNSNVFCTAPTAAIMRLRLKKNAGKQFTTPAFGEAFVINGISITFFPAGHILGSALVLMVHNGVRYLYTGDFKVQEDQTCEPLQLVEADVLITETTFADPNVAHPNVEDELKKLNSSNHNILLGAYSLGKSQRLVNLLNRYCPQRKVFLHHSMLPITKIYESFKFSVGSYEPYNRKLMKMPGQGFVYIVPPLTFESYFRAKNVLRVFASGWKKLQHQNDLELYISDHADWSDLLNTIEKVNPSQVWTLHGNGTHLKNHFQDKLHVKILN